MNEDRRPDLFSSPDEVVDEYGDVQAIDEVIPRADRSLNRDHLLEEHPEYSVPRDGVEDANPGPATLITERSFLLKETLNALALARKAGGRAINKNDRGYIANNIGISPSEVNDHGAVLQPEHRKNANHSFAKLAGYKQLQEAGFSTVGMPRTEDFEKAYFGSPIAKKANEMLRRKLDGPNNKSKRRVA